MGTFLELHPSPTQGTIIPSTTKTSKGDFYNKQLDDYSTLLLSNPDLSLSQFCIERNIEFSKLYSYMRRKHITVTGLREKMSSNQSVQEYTNIESPMYGVSLRLSGIEVNIQSVLPAQLIVLLNGIKSNSYV